MTRYALYFAPAPDSPWWAAGCRWLGRDPASLAETPQGSVAGVPQAVLAKLTADARRYGFHATLKAPFRLQQAYAEPHLLAMAEAFCAAQRPLMLEDVRVGWMGDFLALRPAGPDHEIKALAARCVNYFDMLRAPPESAELAKRRNAGAGAGTEAGARLSARQEELLQRWGYPYVEEEFRFHLTLTDRLAAADPVTRVALHAAAATAFGETRAASPLVVDALTLFREEQPGAPFSIWRRFPFTATAQDAALPAGGRLFYCVGASGAGKDTLLQWVKQRAPNAIVFAQRTITRPPHPSEVHEPMEEAAFLQLAAAGGFAMTWQAHGLYYGIRRGIEAELKAGRDVIVNGSREYVPSLRQSFPAARVIWVDADPALIRDRIESRQRETGAALLTRVERAMRFEPQPEHQAIRLDNNGPVQRAGQRLLEILSGEDRAGRA